MNNMEESKCLQEIVLEQKRCSQREYCILPLCHTLEAEAMGANVIVSENDYGTAKIGTCKYQTMEELRNMDSIQYEKGRIRETLECCKMLRTQGEHVMLMVSGPFTIMNVFLELHTILTSIDKDRDNLKLVLDIIKRELVEYVEKAMKSGVELISFGDPIFEKSILGPKRLDIMLDLFYYDFLSKIVELVNGCGVLVCCPRFMQVLQQRHKLVAQSLKLEQYVSYDEICIRGIGGEYLIGSQCVHQVNKQRYNTVVGYKLI